MTIESLPNVKYYELDSNPEWTGDGSRIPVIIGPTGVAVENLNIQKFKSFAAANKSTSNGGIGTDIENNKLLKFLKEFFEESAKQKTDDMGVPYVYVINMGNAPVTSSTYSDAIDLAKSKREVKIELYPGLTGENSDIIALMDSVESAIRNDAVNGSPRIALFTKNGATDEELISLTDDSEESFIQKPRIGLAQPTDFGKICANFCTTPYYEEVGYSEFRTIESETYNTRTPEEELALQNAGVIFIRDELTKRKILTRINLGVSTAFAKGETAPNDRLFHARVNTDNLIERVYDVLFSQLKKNETEINLKHLQTDIDSIVDEEIEAGNMMKGTDCSIDESASDPYNIQCEGNAVPVNSTLSIGFGIYVSSPNPTVLN